MRGVWPWRGLVSVALTTSALAAGPAVADTDVLFTSANMKDRRSIISDRLLETIALARRSAHVAVAHLDYRRIADGLVKLRKERPKLDLRVLLDLGEYAARDSKSTLLEKGGVEVRYKTYSMRYHHPMARLMHHKFLVVDGARLVTGSYNWSETAEFSNYENAIFMDGPENADVVREYEAEFERMWELGRERYQPFMERLSASRGSEEYRRWIPIHFSPMTLDRKEAGRIRYQAQKSGLFRNSDAVGHWWWDRERRVASDEFPVIPFLEFGRVLISEVLHSPEDAARGEFVEVYNGAELPVDLAGWRLDDGDGVDLLRPWKDGGTTVLAPRAFALILDPDADPKGLPDGALLLTVKDGRAIGNGLGAGDVLRLLRPDDSLADETPALAATATGDCLARPSSTAQDLVVLKAGKTSPGAPNPGW